MNAVVVPLAVGLVFAVCFVLYPERSMLLDPIFSHSLEDPSPTMTYSSYVFEVY